jgi:hypothetical protein
MPKRWKISAELVLTDHGTEVDRDESDWETDNEKRRRTSSRK